MIYHVVNYPQWQEAVAQGFYEHPSLAKEGFIHASMKEQVQGVIERYYAGQDDLLILHIDEGKLESPHIFELAPSINEEFPHIYGRINLDAVVDVTKW
ncbi:DUF952 domain-containing protein [Ferruginibacter sp. SUN106]|uniref:DUF952 domain-containing protein n=1 Tax=Ferruginibacter sp. SUN106 TaxID=2978348 RepID=UPI003D35FA32